MDKRTYIYITIIALAAAGVVLWFSNPGCLIRFCTLTDLWKIENFKDCAARGFPIMESYPRQCRAGDKTFAEDIGNVLKKENLIRITRPRPNDTIESPLIIEGEARGNWYFEASFPIVLRDEQGAELGTVAAQAQGEWMTTDFVPFRAILYFDQPTTEQGTLVLKKDNPSGLPEHNDELYIPITFERKTATGETTKVFAYFSSSTMNPSDPPQYDCLAVFPVERFVPKTSAPARTALEALLKGPTGSEVREGYFTSINPGVTIQKLTIENGTARVDFDETLERAVGGSCRVAAISSQITQTLKQFPNVRNVVISINGRTEDILQP